MTLVFTVARFQPSVPGAFRNQLVGQKIPLTRHLSFLFVGGGVFPLIQKRHFQLDALSTTTTTTTERHKSDPRSAL